jgi:hypothetical protein
MDRRRQAAVAVLSAVLVVGCGQAASQAPPAAAEHRFVHVHEFPDLGIRIAPPTAQPKLSWQQALQAVNRRNDGWPARTPPQVKLADYSHRDNGEGPVRPTLTWIVVYPDAEDISMGGGPESGPDFAPPAPREVGHCPAYVVVDATSGRRWGAFQTCDPKYRG